VRGAALLLLLLVASSGCASSTPPEGRPVPGADPDLQPIDLDLFLKAAYQLAPMAPTKSAPDRVAANPMVNGFANEDLRVFASEPLPGDVNVSRVKIIAYYEVVAPTADPFPVTSNPAQSRQIVFWVGSGGIYPASVSTVGDTVLVPGRIYRAEAEIPLPKPGWIVPRGEPIQLLVATLAFNDRGAELRFLVDSTDTPSRLEIEATTDTSPKPVTLHRTGRDIEILGNSGLFTGATADAVPSRVRTPVEVRTNDTYLEVRVIFRSNAGGKSDLDFSLLAPDGRVAAVSSTPYQSETVRLFGPNLFLFGPGTYQADVVAYSGANTKYTLETRFDSPR
jgi:hypothetical protein